MRKLIALTLAGMAMVAFAPGPAHGQQGTRRAATPGPLEVHLEDCRRMIRLPNMAAVASKIIEQREFFTRNLI